VKVMESTLLEEQGQKAIKGDVLPPGH
jgi:hypothetical protein